MKQIYVVNLNQKRILLLTGVFLIVLGTSLWLGIKLGRSQSADFLGQNGYLNSLDTEATEDSMNLPVQVDDPLSLNYTLGKNREDKISLDHNESHVNATRPIPPIDLPTLSSSNKLNIKTKDPMAGSLGS